MQYFVGAKRKSVIKSCGRQRKCGHPIKYLLCGGVDPLPILGDKRTVIQFLQLLYLIHDHEPDKYKQYFTPR